MSSPTVTIVMPAFNHADYIDKAIASALAQTWQDFELIVVDDGSTDATKQVVAQFGASIRYVYQENRGQGGSRNRGIASASGEYICFLDDDDLWEPGYLTTVLSIFQRQPKTAAVYTGYRIIDGEGNLLPQIGNRVVPPGQMYDALINGGWFPPLVVSVRKACLDQVGPLDETLRGHDDWDLWLRIARRHTFQGIPDVLGLYRIHAGGLSADIGHMLRDHKQAITKHFGPEEGDPASWPPNRRRAFGAAYRIAAVGCMHSGNPHQGRMLLAQAFEIEPDLIRQLDTFYELACGDQPRGYRGDAELLDVDRRGAEMLQDLEVLFARASTRVRELKGVACGNAYLALGMLSDQAGRWSSARRYLVLAIKHNPSLFSRPFLRRLVKVTAGKAVVRFASNSLKFISVRHASTSENPSTGVE